MASSNGPSRLDGPGHTRTIALTDAIVAIAMTILVLPVVDAASEADTAHLGRWLGEHSDLLVSFVISFLVIYVFWAVHAAALRQVEDRSDEVPFLAPLNMLWLLTIAFLPFPTAVVGHHLDTASAPFYIGTMFALSALTSGIVTVTTRASADPARRVWAWVTTAVFGLCALIALFDADVGLYSLLLLAVVRLVETRWLRGHPGRPQAPGSTAGKEPRP